MKKVFKTTLSIFLSLFIFVVINKAIMFLIHTGGIIGLDSINTDILDSDRAFRNLEAVASILGFIGGFYVAYKTYKSITK